MHSRYGWNGTVSRAFPLMALVALVACFHSTPGAAQSSLTKDVQCVTTKFPFLTPPQALTKNRSSVRFGLGAFLLRQDPKNKTKRLSINKSNLVIWGAREGGRGETLNLAAILLF